jgi:hypothetical protein
MVPLRRADVNAIARLGARGSWLGARGWDVGQAFGPAKGNIKHSIRDDPDDVMAVALGAEVAGCDSMRTEAHFGGKRLDV